ncbi:MAG: type VII toxin-antitoxin system HepT family RNase toxin [Promethearchaeota archaeon]
MDPAVLAIAAFDQLQGLSNDYVRGIEYIIPLTFTVILFITLIQRIIEKFDQGKQYIAHIREVRSHTIEEYIENADLQFKGERLFEIITQILLDICSHIVANSDLPAPKSYADCMNALQKLDVIGLDEVKKYRQIVQMRNLISHRYGTLDHAFIFNSLGEIIDDFANYQKSVLKWMA